MKKELKLGKAPTLVPRSKLEESEKIRKDVEEFVKNGGKIKKMKNGEIVWDGGKVR